MRTPFGGRKLQRTSDADYQHFEKQRSLEKLVKLGLTGGDSRRKREGQNLVKKPTTWRRTLNLRHLPLFNRSGTGEQ